jgi:ribose transport system substrate-binding protein
MKKQAVGMLLSAAIAASLLAGCGGTTSKSGSSASSGGTTSGSASDSSEAVASESVKYSAIAGTSATTIDKDYGMPFTATELSSGKTIGVSVQTQTNAFFNAEIDGVKQTLEQGGIKATVLSPDPANDINTQVEQITEMCSRGVDVIFVDAIDAEGIKPALEEAKRANIPVVAIDSSVTDTDLLISTVESNNVDMGKMAAESLCKAIGGKGKIAVINWSTLQAVRDRVSGLKEVIQNEYPDVEIVADQDADGVVEDAQSIMESFMQTYPDLKGVFAINSPTAQGTVAAIQAANKTGQIFVSSIDGSQNDIDMIKENQIICSPVQFPATIANKAMEITEQYWAGNTKNIDPLYYVTSDNITSDNVDQYDGQTY